MRDGSARYLHALRSLTEELAASTGIAFSVSEESRDSVTSAEKLPVFDASLPGATPAADDDTPSGSRCVPLRLPDGQVLTLSATGGKVDLEVVGSVIERYLTVAQGHQAEVDDLASQLLEAYEEINLFFDLATSFGEATGEEQLGEILVDRVLEATRGDTAALILTVDESLEMTASKGGLSGSSGYELLRTLPELDGALSRGVSSNTAPQALQGNRPGSVRRPLHYQAPPRGGGAGKYLRVPAFRRPP